MYSQAARPAYYRPIFSRFAGLNLPFLPSSPTCHLSLELSLPKDPAARGKKERKGGRTLRENLSSFVTHDPARRRNAVAARFHTRVDSSLAPSFVPRVCQFAPRLFDGRARDEHRDPPRWSLAPADLLLIRTTGVTAGYSGTDTRKFLPG